MNVAHQKQEGVDSRHPPTDNHFFHVKHAIQPRRGYRTPSAEHYGGMSTAIGPMPSAPPVFPGQYAPPHWPPPSVYPGHYVPPPLYYPPPMTALPPPASYGQLYPSYAPSYMPQGSPPSSYAGMDSGHAGPSTAGTRHRRR